MGGATAKRKPKNNNTNPHSKQQPTPQRWATWESRLAYYDRTYGKLLDEWYEDVINEGNLDADTPHDEGEPPADGDNGVLAQGWRGNER